MVMAFEQKCHCLQKYSVLEAKTTAWKHLLFAENIALLSALDRG